MLAEGIGAFIYVWMGCGAACAFYVSSASGAQGFGSLFTVGLAYGIAVCFGIMSTGPTSGGHINPGYTITFALFKGFPWREVPFYIAAQIFGAFLGALLVYVQYKQPLDSLTSLARVSTDGESDIFSTSGPAGNFAFFLAPEQKIGYAFVNEFVANVVMAVIVFSITDGTNFMVPQAAIPVVIGLTLSVLIWSFGIQSLALNTARDVGGRLAAAVIWGRSACPWRYSLLAALTNLLATPCGALIQLAVMGDLQRPVVHRPPPARKTGDASSEKPEAGPGSALAHARATSGLCPPTFPLTPSYRDDIKLSPLVYAPPAAKREPDPTTVDQPAEYGTLSPHHYRFRDRSATGVSTRASSLARESQAQPFPRPNSEEEGEIGLLVPNEARVAEDRAMKGSSAVFMAM